MSPSSRRRAAATGLAGVAVLCSCSGGGSTRKSAPLPTGAPEVTVAMRDYAFDYNHAIPAGRVVFRARNVGHTNHQLLVVPLPEDLPPIDEQLHGSTRQSLIEFGGTRPREPGESGTFAVDLVAGQRYALLCLLADGDGPSHAIMGMNSEFRAGAPETKGSK